ncbi:MAG: hypothetical protein ACPG4X_21580 [Pikeienuella sp.]
MTRKAITITGGDELRAALTNMSEEVEQAVMTTLKKTGITLRGDIVKRYQRGPASGRIYTRGGVVHQASASGEAPMSDTGRLANATLFEADPSTLSVSVVNRSLYAPMLEFGTRNIAPRPAWTPAAEEIAPKFRNDLANAINGATK